MPKKKYELTKDQIEAKFNTKCKQNSRIIALKTMIKANDEEDFLDNEESEDVSYLMLDLMNSIQEILADKSGFENFPWSKYAE